MAATKSRKGAGKKAGQKKGQAPKKRQAPKKAAAAKAKPTGLAAKRPAPFSQARGARPASQFVAVPFRPRVGGRGH